MSLFRAPYDAAATPIDQANSGDDGTYAFDQMHYSVLDHENIAQGHLAYYLRWTQQALKQSGDAWAAKVL